MAVARKLAILLHHLWVSGEVYEPLRNRSAADSKAALRVQSQWFVDQIAEFG